MLYSDSNMDIPTTRTTSTSSLTTSSTTKAVIDEEQNKANETPPDPFEILRNECYERLNQTVTSSSAAFNGVTGKFCPGTFDGWLCWPDTSAGTSAYERCPEFITGFDPLNSELSLHLNIEASEILTIDASQLTKRTTLIIRNDTKTPFRGYAHKDCDANGEWFKHPLTNKSWSNYTTCVNIDDLEWKHNINLIYEVGYSISLVAILLSLAILGYFKSLKCARITLHMNLFASFAANNSLWLVWYMVVMPDAEMLHQNPPSCVALHVILQYFLLTNYSWMLCEGFYLHTVLVSAFISEKRLVKWLIAFGWSSPAVVIFVYGLARGLLGSPNDNIICWMNSTNFDNILVVPVCISMFLNLLFLCNIVRVVLLKMKAPAGLQNSCGPSRTVLQAFRATLLLVPLLGLQYILTPFRPEPLHPWEHTYEVISAFTASFQGLCVATFFCFFNGEVIAQVKRKWRTIFLSNRPRTNSYTATQVSFVRCGPTMPGEEKV